MNQAVQIVDGYVYISEKRALRIEALDHGQLIGCFIEGIEAEHAEGFYRNYQFDIEEVLIALIIEQGANQNGEVWCSAAEIKN